MNDKTVHNFEVYWDKLSQDQKAALIKKSVDLGPDPAIQIVLKGIDSPHFAVRTLARETLKTIQAGIFTRLTDTKDKTQKLNAMKDSARVCSRLFFRIKPGISFEEQHFILKTLLGFEGSGALFAFKALSMRRITLASMEKIILTLPDSQRLNFIQEYLKATPELRLKFGAAFKQMVQSVKQTDAVVRFYAGLFDTEQDVDPFLYNLHPDLRDPEKIITGFVRSDSPGIRTIGLKALAMTVQKIHPGLLMEILLMKTHPEVRQTVYKIIENSALGTYPEIFRPILMLLEKSDEEEAFYAFKALIVSGKLPLTEVLGIVREKHPHLMGPIYKEISNLSKISFFFIQDMALNRSAYTGSNIEINLAAAFGMIKKRPERVVRMLKNHISPSNGEMKKEAGLFIKKIKQLLAMEGLGFEEIFHAAAREMEKIEPAQPEGIFKSFFSSSGLVKKIEALKKNKTKEAIDFDGETITHADLSSLACHTQSVCFSNCIIKDSNFSNASFASVSFKNSTLYQVDFQNAVFSHVSFDNAVFIDVNAKAAVFKDCSFHGISIHNCKFDEAVMNSSFFIASTLSKSSFEKTDLSCSSFAYAAIRGISFVFSNLDQTDFTGVQAQFCRFPAHIRPALLKEDIDLNARKYQLKPEDMPKWDTGLLSKLNMMIFGEFIHYGEIKFIRQNRYSLITAFDIFKSKQADLFQIIPFLLHENTALPGMKKDFEEQTPCGIFDYHPDPETLDIISKYIRGKKYAPAQFKNPAIEGLFTMGSIGSVAQSDDSDIDYWVCINEARFSEGEIALLEKKLRMVEQYAWEEFHIQVTFFLVDILKARDNDFGDSTMESSGSAQAMLLKEEFYRAMIHVAGKLPLWSVLPTAFSKNYYNDILNMVSAMPDFFRYIDLGDIHAVPTGEFFGASIWQMFKSLKSPFKSILKMALLEKYVCEYGEKPLLCNLYKDEWMNSGVNLKLTQNDAYYILVDNLLAYFEGSGDKESVSLLLTCFFLKLGISKPGDMDNTVFGLRKILLENCLAKWGWSREKMFRAGDYKSWPYKDIVGLSNLIEAYMIKKYKFLSKAFETLPDAESLISAEDRTVLGRKVYSELSRQPDKIAKLLLVSKSDIRFSGLHVKYQRTNEGKAVWDLINKNSQVADRVETLVSAKTIEEIGAWLMVNQIYNNTSIVNLIPNPTPVTTDDIRKLFKTLYDYFGPLIHKPVGFAHLLKKDTLAGVLISVNFYAPRQQREITHYTLIYMNTWGEMFLKSVSLEKDVTELEDLKKSVQAQFYPAALPENTVCCFRGLTKKF
ncbi:MAG: hypothetical protein A2277_20885 [Desulfobacterales bacterium RIFOXYA12_FULL_46_15]|nr:MAG: hypothetical protein A2277_20885 [Desulfobacterales bacterium RIFOXYA12_FULL_46_15]